MIGCDRHEGGAEDACRAASYRPRAHFRRRRATVGQRPADQQAFRTADPVALHQPHFFRPLVEAVQRVQQILREVGDLEEPLRQLALFDQRARAPAASVDHLLVGKHGHVLRIPVDLGGFARHQPLLDEVEEQHLLAVVIVDIAGGELARPVERQAHDLELLAHGGDVLVGPVLRMDLVLHRRVFGRHAEGVPAHRMQHVEPLGALVARHDIAHRVVADMAHMDAPRRIGEHLEHVVFRVARIVVVSFEQLLASSQTFCQLGFWLRADCIVRLPSDVFHLKSMREQPDMPGGSGNVVAVFTMDCRTRQLRRSGRGRSRPESGYRHGERRRTAFHGQGEDRRRRARGRTRKPAR